MNVLMFTKLILSVNVIRFNYKALQVLIKAIFKISKPTLVALTEGVEIQLQVQLN